MASEIVKIQKGSIPILGLFAAVVLGVGALKDFGVADFSSQQGAILTILASFFVASEIGVASVFSGKGFSGAGGIIRGIALFVVIFSLLGAILSLLGMTVSALSPFMGVAKVGLLIYAITEIFVNLAKK